MTRGSNDVTMNKWQRIEAGDVVMFGDSSGVIATAEVTFKAQLKDLAASLWGYKDALNTWECVYFIKNVRRTQIPKEFINRKIGYAPNFAWQSSNVKQFDGQGLLTALGLTETNQQVVTQPQYTRAVKELIAGLDETDKDSQALVRMEQGYLRQHLFHGRDAAACALCGNSYSPTFLVTAHVKKRSICSEPERLDMENIVMPLCKFGCDELYEHGYVIVRAGRIEEGIEIDPSDRAYIYRKRLIGKTCCHWAMGENARSYFHDHAKYHGLVEGTT